MRTVIKLIELPKYPSTDWYKKIINNLSTTSYINPMNDMLDKLFSFIHYSKYKNIYDFSIAPFEDIKEVYEKMKGAIPTNYFYYTQEYKDKNGNERKRKVFNDNWKAYINAYNRLVKDKMNLDLINHLNIKCCPYCNENYIFNRKNHSSAQLGHFYPKDEYPIFAICLYNLVPACPACNHIKGIQDIGVSPYDHSLNFDELKISYNPKSSNWINDSNELEIIFKYDKSSNFGKKIKQNLTVFELEEAYKNHTDYVQEILKKVEIYNDATISNIRSDFPSLFSSDEEVIQMIFGNYIKKIDFLKRPLSKLTHDILEENRIIK